MADLIPADPLAPLPQLDESINVERVYRTGTQGAGDPKCTYTPNPPYTTDEARKFDLSGTVVLLAIVGSDGNMKPFRIERGLPFGLHDNSLRTLQTSKCDPAMFDGKSATVLVPIEVRFRLYRK